MKNSGIEWIGEIPDSWNVVRMKHLYDYSNGSPVRVGPFGSALPSSDIVQEGVWVYTQKTVLEQNFKTNNTFVSQEKAMELVSFAVTDGDVLITTRGTIGKTAVIPNGSPNGILHPCVIRFRIDEKKMSKELLSLIFNQTDIAFGQIMDMSNSTTIEVLYSYSLKEIWLPCPTLDKQLKILEIVKKFAKRIDKCISTISSQIEKLKEYKQSVITEAVTKGLDPTAPMKDSGVEWIGKIPEDWETIRVKQLLNERIERSLTGQEEPLSMSQKVGLVPTRMLDSIPNMASSFIGAKLTYVDDLVFNKLKAHLGVFSVSKYDGLVSPDYAVYYSTGKINLKYLEYLFKTPQCILEFRKRSTGIAVGLTRLYTDGLFAIECPFPNHSSQMEIVAYLDDKCAKIDKLIALKQSKIEKLQEYKKSLIYEYVTGKKEIV